MQTCDNLLVHRGEHARLIDKAAGVSLFVCIWVLLVLINVEFAYHALIEFIMIQIFLPVEVANTMNKTIL